MAGYAVAMRIDRFEIRGGVVARPPGGGRGPIEPSADLAVVELVGREPGQHLQERLADARIYLGQLTWYLFNAEGWR